LGVADILDGAIGYVRRDPRTVLGISAVLSLVLVTLSFVANYATFRSLSALTSADLGDPGAGDGLLSGGTVGGDLTTLAATLLSLPISIIATGLLTVVVGQSVLGRPVDARQAWRSARPRLLPLIALMLLLGLLLGGLLLGGLLVAVLLGLLVGQLSVALGILLGLAVGGAAIVATIWLAVRWLLAPVALVLEKCGPVTAMRRSAQLVRASWWRVFGIALLAQVIAGLISQVLTVPFAVGGVLLAVGFPDSSGLWWVTLAAVSLGSFVASVVTMPFVAGVTALQYIDRRIRREALDIELARAGLTG
jgi:hypothetical protein